MSKLRTVALLLLLCLGVACGVGKGAPQWVGSDAAVVRCTVAGPNLQLPPLFDELPSPALPTGLLARTMDPIALDELGYERDRAVCATLLAPDAAELDTAATEIDKLIDLRNDTAKRARKQFGRCLCSYADALDARALVIGCIEKPTLRNCDADPEQINALAELLAPLEAQLAATHVPRLHWRLFGRTDRPGRFVARHDQVLGRHLGGSEVFLPRAALPPVPGSELLAGLLTLDHVVAVVRQDSGRGVVVVREIDNLLIFDHFAYPDLLGSGARGVDVELLTMLGRLDDEQLAWYRDALAPPEQARELMFEPRKGYLVELDRAALERVDRSLIVAARYAGLRYDETVETRELPTVLVDRVAHQVPYGTEGQQLRMRARLSDDGRAWFDAVGDVPAIEALTSLGAIDRPTSFTPADPHLAQLFVLRGQPIEQLSFAGASALPLILHAIELAAPGSVKGDIDEFTVTLPSGPLPGQFESRPGIEMLRERLSITPHRLSIERVDGGRTLALELQAQ